MYELLGACLAISIFAGLLTFFENRPGLFTKLVWVALLGGAAAYWYLKG